MHRSVPAPTSSFLLALVVAVSCVVLPAGAAPPGDDSAAHRVVMARATWDTGWFQAEVYRLLLEELGYDVQGPATMENEAFYAAVATDEVDFWVNGWFPLHQGYVETHGPGDPSPIVPVGRQVPEGSLQGYLVDRRTAERHGIDSLDDLRDPAIARLFDTDGDGRADLIGCNAGWGCAEVIEHQLDAYDLRSHVEQIQGDYTPLMYNLLERYERGDPVLFYTWTPNWTVGSLRPGEDVVWLEVPFASLPSGDGSQEGRTTVRGVDGCPSDPCAMGWPPNDVRAVANRAFLRDHPALRHLLEVVEISSEAIHTQNARMFAGEDTAADIRRHAEEWVESNRATVNVWLDGARALGVPADASMASLGPGDALPPRRELRIATKILPPFVMYEDRGYRGFSVELVDHLASELDLDYGFYGVNSMAKLLDEAARSSSDVSVSSIAITSDREASLDFSHAYFQSGLQILVPDENAGFFGGLFDRFSALMHVPQLLDVIFLFFLVIFVVSHVIWWIERRRNPDFPHGYVRGVFAGLWWAIVTVTTVGYGDTTPKRNTGKVFALVWLLAGYFVFAYFTATVTTTFTVSEIRNTIEGPEDLFGRRVGTVEGSTAHDHLLEMGVRTRDGATIESVVASLEAGELDAVVYHAPFLQYYAGHEGKGRVRVVGRVFSEQQYGLALPPGSPLREPLNRALLELMENGTYRTIHSHWFEG